MINIRDRKTSSDMEGPRLDLLEAQLKMETRESVMSKFQYNQENSVTSFYIERQEG